MKKLLLLVVTLTMTLMANAQVSVQFGYLLNTLKTTLKDNNTDIGKFAGSYRGIMATVDYNIHITDYLGVAPGLGIDYSFNDMDGSKYRELGLIAPIDINYCIPISDALSVSFFAGPTFYYGLISKETGVNPHYDYYKEDNKRFDVSLGGGAWLDILEHIRVKFGYKFGLTNTSRIEGITERNNLLSISVGYVF